MASDVVVSACDGSCGDAARHVHVPCFEVVSRSGDRWTIRVPDDVVSSGSLDAGKLGARYGGVFDLVKLNPVAAP